MKGAAFLRNPRLGARPIARPQRGPGGPEEGCQACPFLQPTVSRAAFCLWPRSCSLDQEGIYWATRDAPLRPRTRVRVSAQGQRRPLDSKWAVYSSLGKQKGHNSLGRSRLYYYYEVRIDCSSYWAPLRTRAALNPCGRFVSQRAKHALTHTHTDTHTHTHTLFIQHGSGPERRKLATAISSCRHLQGPNGQARRTVAHATATVKPTPCAAELHGCGKASNRGGPAAQPPGTWAVDGQDGDRAMSRKKRPGAHTRS